MEIELTSDVLINAAIKILFTIILVGVCAWALNEPREHWRVEKKKGDKEST